MLLLGLSCQNFRRFAVGLSATHGHLHRLDELQLLGSQFGANPHDPLPPGGPDDPDSWLAWGFLAGGGEWEFAGGEPNGGFQVLAASFHA